MSTLHTFTLLSARLTDTLTTPVSLITLGATGAGITSGMLVWTPERLGPHGPTLGPIVAMLFLVGMACGIVLQLTEALSQNHESLIAEIDRLRLDLAQADEVLHETQQELRQLRRALTDILGPVDAHEPVWDLLPTVECSAEAIPPHPAYTSSIEPYSLHNDRAGSA